MHRHVSPTAPGCANPADCDRNVCQAPHLTWSKGTTQTLSLASDNLRHQHKGKRVHAFVAPHPPAFASQIAPTSRAQTPSKTITKTLQIRTAKSHHQFSSRFAALPPCAYLLTASQCCAMPSKCSWRPSSNSVINLACSPGAGLHERRQR